jgi:phosphoserine phosphatase
MNNPFYQKLVDLYAAEELPEELTTEMEAAAMDDEGLRSDMNSLRLTVNALQQSKTDGMTEVCYQRVLRRIMDEANLPEQRQADADQYRLNLG